MNALTDYLQAQLPAMTEMLTQLVSIESQSDEKAGVDRVGAYLAHELASLGAVVTRFEEPERGDHVLGTFKPGCTKYSDPDPAHGYGTFQLAHSPRDRFGLAMASSTALGLMT